VLKLLRLQQVFRFHNRVVIRPKILVIVQDKPMPKVKLIMLQLSVRIAGRLEVVRLVGTKERSIRMINRSQKLKKKNLWGVAVRALEAKVTVNHLVIQIHLASLKVFHPSNENQHGNHPESKRTVNLIKKKVANNLESRNWRILILVL